MFPNLASLPRTPPARFPRAAELPFASFKNKYAKRTCYIVGRGPTAYDYADLAHVPDPIFFINDAVCLEQFARSETFFFAHDRQLQVWLDGSIHSTAVLPIEGGVLAGPPRAGLGHVGPVVRYHRGIKADRRLLEMGRDEIAHRQELLVHSGTIHSAIHFAWFCGFRGVVFIGCDGISGNEIAPVIEGTDRGYDNRLANRSQSRSAEYRLIRRVQDLLVALFQLEAEYVGTPLGPTQDSESLVR